MILSTILPIKTRILSGLIFLLCLTATVCQAQLKVGDNVPEIKLPDSVGKWTLLSEVNADIIVVDFWAAWCPPCVVAVQELKKIKEAHPNASLEIFAVSLDRDYWKWVNLVRKLNLPFIHVNDAYGLRSPRCKTFGVQSIPTKFLIKSGKLMAINPSFVEIEKYINN